MAQPAQGNPSFVSPARNVAPRTGRPIRVAFVYDSIQYGGVEEFLLLLLRYMDRSRVEACIILSGHNAKTAPARFLDAVRSLGVKVTHAPIPRTSRYLSAVEDIRGLRRVFRDERIDIVHIHTPNADGGRRATIAARLQGVKAVIRSEHVAPSATFKPHFKYTLKPLDWMTDRVIAGSESNRVEHVELLGRPREKVSLIYYGIERQRFDPQHDVVAAKAALGYRTDLPLVLAIARLSKEKGLIYLVEAIPVVLKEFGAVQFVIVGSGPLEQELKDRVRELGVENSVIFAGYQTNTVPFMQAADVAVMPSLWEGFSLAMIEFMAMGKACVFSDHESFVEASERGRSAVITPRKDSAAIARGIVRLLKDPEEREALGSAAATRVDQSFSIVSNVQRLHELYDELMA